MLILGWDVSTAIIGVCIMDCDTGSARYQDIHLSGASLLGRYHEAVVAIDELVANLPGPRLHVIEDRLGNFSPGKTMQQTLMKLAQMNAVVSYHLSLDAAVVHVHPSTAKRIAGLRVPKGGDKKALAIALAREQDPSFPYAETKGGNPVAGIADMADARLLAVTGCKITRGEATLDKGTEASGRRRRPRATKDAVSTEE